MSRADIGDCSCVRSKMACPDLQRRCDEMLEQTLWMPPSQDVHLHCETRLEQIQEVLGSVFPFSQQSKRKSWISDAAFSLVKFRVFCRNTLDVCLCFEALTHREAGIEDTAALRRCLAFLELQTRESAFVTRLSLLHDKSVFLDELGQRADDAVDEGSQENVWHTLRPFRPGWPEAPFAH